MLPRGEILDTFEAVPVVRNAQVIALAADDAWLNAFPSPHADLVRRPQIARRELALEAAIANLENYHPLSLDDLAYVTKDQAETSVLFDISLSTFNSPIDQVSSGDRDRPRPTH